MNSLPMTVTRQRRGCDLNPGPSAAESSTLITRLLGYRATRARSTFVIVSLMVLSVYFFSAGVCIYSCLSVFYCICLYLWLGCVFLCVTSKRHVAKDKDK